MQNRIVDISERGCALRVEHRQLVIAAAEAPTVSLPLAELAVLVLAHPQVSLTQPVLTGLLESGGVLVTCDQRRLPLGMLLPTRSHSIQTERFAAQARVGAPRCKQLWRQIVRAKIRAQADLLEELHGCDGSLRPLAASVRSGDPANVEALAARRYWSALFGRAGFRRDVDAGGANALLNYGYAVLRAIVARAICAAGLHPSLGIHHHNRYNAFCLADDLMEPFRPLVDRLVVRWSADHGMDAELDKAARSALLAGLGGRCRMGGESRTVFESASRVASSLAAVFTGQAAQLDLPDRYWEP